MGCSPCLSMIYLIWSVSLPPMTCIEYKLPFLRPSMTCFLWPASPLPLMTHIAALYDLYIVQTNIYDLLWSVSLHSMTCMTTWLLWVKRTRRSNSTTCYCDFYEPIRCIAAFCALYELPSMTYIYDLLWPASLTSMPYMTVWFLCVKFYDMLLWFLWVN